MDLINMEIIQNIRKRSLQSFILFLILTALIAIATILIGNLREFGIKVLIMFQSNRPVRAPSWRRRRGRLHHQIRAASWW